MEQIPAVSVIIPMYQAERHIPAALLSLIRQPEFRHMEVICVDDGSGDRTLERCRWIMAHYPGIRLISLPHRGVSHARNAGIKAAAAPYIAFLDADDCWEEDFFDAEILRLLAEGPDVLAFSWATTSAVPEKNRVFPVPDGLVCGGKAFPELEPRSFCANFYRRALLDTFGIRFPEDICYNEDEQFKLYCLYHAEKIRFFPRLLFTNRLHANSLRAGRYSERGRQQLIRVWKEAAAYFSGLNPPADTMIDHCRKTLETLLDKMNRESCLDECAVRAAESVISPAYSAYAGRILTDTRWHDRLFGRQQPIILMQPDPDYEAALGKVFALLPFSGDFSVADTYLFSVPAGVHAQDPALSLPVRGGISADTLLIFDLTGADLQAHALCRKIHAALQVMEPACMVSCLMKARDGSTIVYGSQQLAMDRTYQIFSAVKPGQIRLGRPFCQ